MTEKDITAESLRLPAEISRYTAGKEFTADGIGMSGCTVLVYEDMVLKITEDTENGRRTAEMMRWMDGRLPVPRVIEHCICGGKSWLLMSKVGGRMCCDTRFLEHPKELLDLLAEGLRMLWSTDISDCPRVMDLDVELAAVRRRVEQGLADTEHSRFGSSEGGSFRDPAELLEWLENNRPSYEPVMSHGDYCLPNVFADNGRISGFIDLEDCGIADRYRDISLCWLSLKWNFDGTFGGKVYPDFDPDMLFDAIGIDIDREKLRYYLLLSELF